MGVRVYGCIGEAGIRGHNYFFSLALIFVLFFGIFGLRFAEFYARLVSFSCLYRLSSNIVENVSRTN